jgi:hypothetical protein
MCLKCSLFLAALLGLFVFSWTAVAQDSLNVTRLDQIHHPGWQVYGWDVDCQDNYAYLASVDIGVTIVNIENPDSIYDDVFTYPPY